MRSSIGYAYYHEKQQEIIKASLNLQVFAMLVTILLAIVFSGLLLAYSVAVGAACAIIPNLYFAYSSFRYIGARNASKVLRSVYVAEAVKFALVICLLIISNSFAQVSGLLSNSAILLGFSTVFFSMLFLPLVTK